MQVLVVLGLELTLLPLLHGAWASFCLIGLFGDSVQSRTAWLHASPVSFCLFHWLLGMAFLMSLAAFLSLLRSCLRPGANPSLVRHSVMSA